MIPAEMSAGSGVANPLMRRIFGIRGKLRIFRRRYIVGTLTKKANIIISYYLVPYRLSTLNGHFALNSVLHRYVWSCEPWLSKLGYY